MPDVYSEPHETQGDFYTVEEAATVLQRTPGRIRQLLRDGTLEGEGGGDPKDPWRVHKWAVHALRDESPRRRRGSAQLRAEQTTGEHPSESTIETPRGAGEASELRSRVEALQRELGRLEGRLELTEVAESTLRESLERERERADRLEEELRESRRPWWRRMFGQ